MWRTRKQLIFWWQQLKLSKLPSKQQFLLKIIDSDCLLLYLPFPHFSVLRLSSKPWERTSSNNILSCPNIWSITTNEKLSKSFKFTTNLKLLQTSRPNKWLYTPNLKSNRIEHYLPIPINFSPLVLLLQTETIISSLKTELMGQSKEHHHPTPNRDNFSLKSLNKNTGKEDHTKSRKKNIPG